MDIYGQIRDLERKLRMAELNDREWDTECLKIDLREKEAELKRLEN